MATNPKYNWLFANQNNRYYPRADQDIPIIAIKTEWDIEKQTYVTKDSFGNIIPDFDEFAKEQRDYFKRFCSIVGNTGREKPWLVFDYDSDLESGYSTTNYLNVSGNEFTGYATGCTGPMPSKLADLTEWGYYKDTNTYSAYSPEKFIAENDGNPSWPLFSQYIMVCRCPANTENNLIARQVAPRGGVGIRDQRVSPIQVTKTFVIQESGFLDENDTYPLSYLLGTVKDWTEYEAGVDTIITLENNAGFQILREKGDQYPDGFDATDWFLATSPSSTGWLLKEIKVYEHEILIRTIPLNLSEATRFQPLYMSQNITLTDDGDWKLPKFKWKNNALLEDQTSSDFDRETYTLNDGSVPNYAILYDGPISYENGGDRLVGHLAVKIETPQGDVFLRVKINNLNQYDMASVFPYLPIEVFTSTNIGFPEKYVLTQYKSLHAALADVDVNNVQFIDASYDGDKWNIAPQLNWYDDMWLKILQIDLGDGELFDYASNTIMVDGKMCFHDRVRVLVDGEFNENNKIFERKFRDRTGKSIHAIKTKNAGDLVLDKDFNCYSFPYTLGELNGRGGNNEIAKGQYVGFDRLFLDRFIKEDYSAASPTPEPPDNKLTAWKDCGFLSDGTTFTPADGNVSVWDFWEGSDSIKIWDDDESYSGTPYYSPAYEPAYIGEWIAVQEGAGFLNGLIFVNKNDNLDIRLSPGVIAGYDYWGGCTHPTRIVDIQDDSTSSAISVQYYIPDLDADWVGSQNKERVTKVLIDFKCQFTDWTGYPTTAANRHEIIGWEVVDYIPGQVNTWTPPSTYPGDATVSLFQAYAYAQQDMQAPQGLTATVQQTDPTQPVWAVPIQLTTHYINESRSADAYNIGTEVLWNARRNAMIGANYGKITHWNCQGMGKANFFYQINNKPFIRLNKLTGKTDSEYFLNDAYRQDDSPYINSARVAGFACKYGDSMQLASAACDLTDDIKNSYPDKTRITVNSDNLVTYEATSDVPFIDVVEFNTDRDVQLTQVIYNLPNTQFYINNSDEIWDSIETRIEVWGLGNVLNYSGYDIPQLRQHVFSGSSDTLTISSRTDSNYAAFSDYSWDFTVIRPDIDMSNYTDDREIIVDCGNHDQHIEVFASTTDHDYFTLDFENKIKAIKQANGTYKLDISYALGTKFRIYIWDTVMSLNIRSKEYTSLGPLPISGSAGSSTTPTPLDPSGGGIVDV